MDPLEPQVQNPSLDRDSTNLFEICLAVHREVWNEFYTWEQDACQDVMGSLAPGTPNNSHTPVLDHVDHGDSDIDDAENWEADLLTVWEYDKHGGCTKSSQLSLMEVQVQQFKSYPKYEACTPSTRSISRDDQDSWSAPFVPFADDPSFAFTNYLEQFESFRWQTDFKDPDLEVIEIETTRRLFYGQDISFNDIDRLSIVPQLRITNASGLVWDMTQRDSLLWPGSALSPYPRLPSNLVPAEAELRSYINRSQSNFCPNLNCLYHFCSAHATSHPNVDPIKPTVTSSMMKLSEGNTCGEDCFRLIDDTADAFMEAVYWENPADVETLSCLLELTPDLLPCELAVICRKPCCEIFVYRCKILSDDKILERQYIEEGAERTSRRKPKFVDGFFNGTPNYTPLQPCHHRGICNQTSSCPCFENGQRCQRSCRCGFDCEVRWKGCKCDCEKKTRVCEDERCRCRRAGRECDPELCTKCETRILGNPDRACQNNVIQKGLSQIVEIKHGKFGVGAFATCHIPKNTFIGDYVGEILSREASTVHLCTAKHIGLNYYFELNSTIVLDAARVGNETRYLNHSDDPNCEPKVRLVNGEHRIGLFTLKRVYRGQELFLDYGPHYWTERC